MTATDSSPLPLTILCLANLAWERTLFQRPQQLMTQFASRGHRVLYLSRISSRRWMRLSASEREISIPGSESARAVNLPYFPLSGRVKALNDLTLKRVEKRAGQFLQKGKAESRILWLQHPDYIHIANKLPHELLVYDAMDPFEHFVSSSPWIAEREKETLGRADILFTGGRSLHKQREHLHNNAFCFPSGIDFEHFAKATEDGAIPPDLADIGKPIIGYIGAVDRERVDWKLIQHLCKMRPNWKIVFIGPLVGMDEPPVDAPNLYCLNGRPYERLPDYLRGFDIAMIPWQINDLTRGMSPTKTPEYLAAGRPVVSTAIPDVVSDYGEDVYIANNADEFVLRCDEALKQETGQARKPPQARTWNEIAEAMESIIRASLKQKTAP